jgi:hypothetical protein
MGGGIEISANPLSPSSLRIAIAPPEQSAQTAETKSGQSPSEISPAIALG